ncbi:hypothetical protein EST38_g14294 [Candolleomyces aberdarensis]|uniref:Uncharacterized protein n=1 Tax=Candolleomyces aberdarensis TaxID=2316362 RepID=A0A4Q2D020_9AGAR|nr:hypothetical protein EST38_g14294 [Candolleomyces aberdarensis]
MLLEIILEQDLMDGQVDPSIPDTKPLLCNDALLLMAASNLATYALTVPKDKAGEFQWQGPIVM